MTLRRTATSNSNKATGVHPRASSTSQIATDSNNKSSVKTLHTTNTVGNNTEPEHRRKPVEGIAAHPESTRTGYAPSENLNGECPVIRAGDRARPIGCCSR